MLKTLRQPRWALLGTTAFLAAWLAGGGAVMQGANSGPAGGVCLSGTWHGSWQSCTTGHHGRLRAKLVRCDAAHYQCRFAGTFFKVLPFTYAVPLTVTGECDGVIHFQAERPLRFFGGVFHCAGYATCHEFHATYRSKKDHGSFTMSR